MGIDEVGIDKVGNDEVGRYHYSQCRVRALNTLLATIQGCYEIHDQYQRTKL